MIELLHLFITYFYIGLFTFGGGYAMLPMIQSEIVDKAGWITSGEFVDFIAISESTPGPFAVNMATFIGHKVLADQGVFMQILGGIVATLGAVLPSFIVILIVSRFITRFRSSRLVTGFMYGIKPAAVGLIGAALFSIVGTSFAPNLTIKTASIDALVNLFTSAEFLCSMGILAVALIFAFTPRLKKLHPVCIIGISAALGIVAGYAFGL